MRRIIPLVLAVGIVGADALAAEPTYASGRFALVIDGRYVGIVQAVSGDTFQAPTGTRGDLTGLSTPQTTASLTPQPISIAADLGLSREAYDWINLFLAGTPEPRTAALQELDAEGRVLRIWELQEAHIAEVKFDKLDASGKDPGAIEVTLAPTALRALDGDGGLGASVDSKHKDWLCANFRVEVEGLPTERVLSIEGLGARIGTLSSTERQTTTPTVVEVSKLKLTMPVADSKPWTAWHESVVEAGTAEAKALEGSITLLAPDMKTVLGHIELSHLALVTLKLPELEANKEDLATFEVELSARQIALKLP